MTARQRRRDRRVRDHHATRIHQAPTAQDRAAARWDQLRATVGHMRADGQQRTTRASRKLQEQQWEDITAALATLTDAAAELDPPPAGAAGSWGRKLRGAATPADRAAVRWDQLRRYAAGLETGHDLWEQVDAALTQLATVTQRDIRPGSNSGRAETRNSGPAHRRRAPARRDARARMQPTPNSGRPLRTVTNLTDREGWL